MHIFGSSSIAICRIFITLLLTAVHSPLKHVSVDLQLGLCAHFFEEVSSHLFLTTDFACVTAVRKRSCCRHWNFQGTETQEMRPAAARCSTISSKLAFAWHYHR
jgi:hypothetical protein